MRKLTIGLVLIAVVTGLILTGCSSGIPIKDYNGMIDERDTALADAAAVAQELADAESQIADLEDQLASTQGEVIDLQDELDTLTAELDDLASVYPLKRFPSGEALQTWLWRDDISERGESSDAVVWLARALEQQRRAADDGYLISVEMTSHDEVYYTVLCTAITQDDGFWWWDPETDEAFYWLDIRHF